jgi:hypothetical protein
MAGRGEEQRERRQLRDAQRREKTVKIAVAERFLQSSRFLSGATAEPEGFGGRGGSDAVRLQLRQH